MAKTPYRRLLEWGGLEPQAVQRLDELYRGLNPAELQRQSARLQRLLLKEAEDQALPNLPARTEQAP